MATSKIRCSVCRNYKPREEFYKLGLGSLGGVCSEDCFRTYVAKYQAKRARRKVNRAKKYENSGRRIPGATRDRVRSRDNESCRWCGATDSVQQHHVRYRSEGGPDVQYNLISLCAACHERAHSNKRKYQPVLLTWLWLGYVKHRECTVESVFRMLNWHETQTGKWVAKYHQEWVDAAREYSNQLREVALEKKRNLKAANGVADT